MVKHLAILAVGVLLLVGCAEDSGPAEDASANFGDASGSDLGRVDGDGELLGSDREAEVAAGAGTGDRRGGASDVPDAVPLVDPLGLGIGGLGIEAGDSGMWKSPDGGDAAAEPDYGVTVVDDVLVSGVVVEGSRVVKGGIVDGVVVDGARVERESLVDGVIVDGIILLDGVPEGFEIDREEDPMVSVDRFIVDGAEVEAVIVDGETLRGREASAVDGLIVDRYIGWDGHVASGVFVAVRGVDAAGVRLGGVDSEDLCGWPGPLCARDEGVEPIDSGGRLWWTRPTGWDAWRGRVLDLCDDYEVLAVGHGDHQGRFFEHEGVPYLDVWLGEAGRQQIAELRYSELPECSGQAVSLVEDWSPDSPPVYAVLRGRYRYISARGPMLPERTIKAAVRSYYNAALEWKQRADPVHGVTGPDAERQPLGSLMGQGNYEAMYFRLESRTDEVVVRRETVSVVDGVLRGLAQNRSKRLWARDVRVTATSASGNEGSWRYPLSVQPGEVMPFEIHGWLGDPDLSSIAFDVDAHMSSRIDLSRSLRLNTGSGYHLNGADIMEEYPEELWGGEIADPDADYPYLQVTIRRMPPGSHPELAEAALAQTVADLLVYAATTEHGVVSDVFRLTPVTAVFDEGVQPEWIEANEIPQRASDGRFANFASVAHQDPYVLVWVGSSTAGDAAIGDL